LRAYCEDRQTRVVCYPRGCDSVSFYIGRDDLQSYRSKEVNNLITFLRERPRSVLLLTHRHSLKGLQFALPPDLQLVNVKHFGLSPVAGLPEGLAQKLTWVMGETSLGLCDMAVVERRETEPAKRLTEDRPFAARE
jgi:hypothetical protein